ncbi:MAG: group I intron-associated PD-(D/E)XK endonuclease [Actinomycetota bacterium]
MTPSQVGERAEAAVMAALAATGKHLLFPFGQKRYDLAYEEGGRLIKVQVKSGREVDGAIVFRTNSAVRGSFLDYRGDADVFGVYCHDRGTVYLVPVEDVPRSAGMLRLSAPKNGQKRKVRWASQYQLSPPVSEEEPSDSGEHTLILTNVDVCETLAPMPEISALELPVLCCAPLTGSALNDDEAEATAQLFKALADPHRVRIVNLLANAGEPVCVCDITEAIGLSQPTISFHLKKLVASGLLDREKRATWAYYSLNSAALDQLTQVVKIEGANA